MNRYSLAAAVFLALAIPAACEADPPLHTSLQLSSAQARQTDAIEARYRKSMASVRQEFNRESRALRRARLAHDDAEASRLEGVVETLRQKMIALRNTTDEEIRAVLQPEQMDLFEAYLHQRRTLQGSSRDERVFEK